MNTIHFRRLAAATAAAAALALTNVASASASGLDVIVHVAGCADVTVSVGVETTGTSLLADVGAQPASQSCGNSPTGVTYDQTVIPLPALVLPYITGEPVLTGTY